MPKQGDFKKGGQGWGARKSDSAGDAGKIGERVGICEQVGTIKESGENQSCVYMLPQWRPVLNWLELTW